MRMSRRSFEAVTAGSGVRARTASSRTPAPFAYGLPALLVGLIGLLGLPGAAGAQSAAEAPPPALFGETLDVRVINVEVVVTDRDGTPVHGLGPEDFRLRVDGEEVPIDYFTEIRGSVAVATGEDPDIDPEEGPEEGSPVGLPGLAPGEPVPTSYLVFVDDFFATEQDRDRVLRSLTDQLPFLGPADRMAVVAFDGSDLEMLTSWTGSSRELARALEAARERPALGLMRLAERRAFEARRRFDRRALSRFELSFEEREYAQRLSDQVERAVAAATATLRGFAQPPGRKVMLLLSGGWPYSPHEYAAGDPTAPVLPGDLPTGHELYAPLVETANLLGYTLYPVDVPGLDADFEGDASRAVPGGAGARFTNVERERLVEDTLRLVAERTGGRALINGTRTAALERVVEDTRSYYWLGFTAEREGSGENRDIEVEVTRPGLEVRSRESYQDLSRRAEVSMAVESALLFGGPPALETLSVELGEPERQGRRFVLLPITVGVPAGSVTLLPDPRAPESGRVVGRLELRLAAVDDDGDRSDVPVVPLTLALDAPSEPERILVHRTTVRLRRSTEKLIVAIHDPVGGSLFTRTLELDLSDVGR